MPLRDFLARPTGTPLAVGLALLLATLGPAPAARAEESAPVEALRRALVESLPLTDVPEELTKALQQRAMTLQQLTDDKSQLQSPGDVAEALLLPTWSTGVPETSKVDRDAREALVNRFLRVLRAESKAAAEQPDVRAAVCTMVGEFAVSARGGYLSDQRSSRLLLDDMPRFTELIADLAKSDPSPEVRAAAAAALAKLQSDPVKENGPRNDELELPITFPMTVPTLDTLLKDPSPLVRRAAAAALGDLLRGTRRADRDAYTASPPIEPTRENLLDFGPQVARAAGAVLNDRETDPEVRRLAAAALVQVGNTLNSPLRRGSRELRPVVNALWDQTAALDRASRDPDPRVRHTALRALEEMGDVRGHWNSSEALPSLPPPNEKPRGGPKPPRPGLAAPAEEASEPSELTLTYALAQAPAAKPKDEPAPLADAIPALASALRDNNVRNRLAAIDALEAIAGRPEEQRTLTTLAREIGPQPGATAVKALTRALSDPDRFVRWAAARTLGEMAPLGDVENSARVERGAVGGLVLQLSDADPDVRLRAAVALEKFGKAARAAVPALAGAATNRGDIEARVSAAHAIQVIGGSPAEAVPALAEDLGDSNVRLRRTAAEALASYGASAVQARGALNRALSDSDPEVRRLASVALLKIGRPR